MAKELNCSQVQSLLADYSVGGVGRRRRGQIRAHLRTCPDCSRELQILLASADLLKELPDADPPDDLWDRVLADITALEPATPPRRSLVPTVGLATAGVLAAMLAWIFAKPSFQEVIAPKQLPALSAGFYVHTHLVSSGQDFMLSSAAIAPALRTSDQRKEVLKEK